ncbi:H-type small acid-soluble spore protein [Evansella cellulosilytica]|uniref:Small, acid-soluble spore protein H n=1 Tax=Evansella cellulosilytica (strain ATCC 21833 / DSM 2522 / FERM P-1141 / JCM 9156 / N-4) TaxID=649639 RepID=E6TYZ1_EVAC2|nr:H-type small acid-soluble spore protein [Evansella cellulosilytica]ADU32434.1 small acid-soluble spore protein, H-type [Evansella cellulosilytica DSM 2522]
MHTQRAKEIAQSPDMKNVTYNGEQIYIQHVNDENDTARIFPINDSQNEKEVLVANLKEE